MRSLSCLALSALFGFVLTPISPAVMAAAEPTTRDSAAEYSHLIPLTVSGRQGIVQFQLPRDAYLRSHSANLNDLRLFDADGRKLSFSLTAPPAQSRTSRRAAPVRIFPVFEAGRAGSPLPHGLEIRTSADGSVLSVTTRGTVALNQPADLLSSLILDIGPAAGPDGKQAGQLIDALRLTLPAGTSNYSARVAVEVSDDLKSWRTVGESNLNWLVNNQTEQIANDRLEFAPTASRYVRLSWVEGNPIEFAKIIAEFPIASSSPRHVETLLVAAQPGRFGQDLFYPTPVAIPVEKLGLQLTQQNVSLPAVLGQYVERPSRNLRADRTYEFTPKLKATFFQFAQDGARRASGDLPIASTHAENWVLRPDGPLTEQPALRITWSPATIVFVANGRQPFTLAVGRPDAQSAQLPLSQVAPGFTADELRAVEQAVPGATREQTPTAPNQTMSPVESARWRIVVLWAILILGVAILGFMAWKLTAQMRNESGDRTSNT
ncbi:DUF3999 family protein [Massilia horti]|uniref:DUF3999 family protein n=1 Tax=Massilia horti TaxID=2562153 RepID=A0A4Y9T112_9BURK|nr:DUF3999 family protein [Massilia horti]TFW33114.1 DUF3999 family protein [Massilia horti]